MGVTFWLKLGFALLTGVGTVGTTLVTSKEIKDNSKRWANMMIEEEKEKDKK